MTRISDCEFLSRYVDDGDENVVDLEPILAYRLARAYRTHRVLRDNLTIESGVRTKEEQVELWVAYKAGRGNLAANPDRVIGRAPDGTPWTGSWHMAQAALDGQGCAVDLTTHHKLPWGAVHQLLLGCGLQQTVPGEPWHHQARNHKGIFPGPMPDDYPQPTEDEMTPELEERLDDLKTWVYNSTDAILKEIRKLADQIAEVKKP